MVHVYSVAGPGHAVYDPEVKRSRSYGYEVCYRCGCACQYDCLDSSFVLFHGVVVDTCYVLSFAIIMLNTSLHNPSVKDKPTVDRFVAMNRGINEGGDLPRELLEVGSVSLIWHLFALNMEYFLLNCVAQSFLAKGKKYVLLKISVVRMIHKTLDLTDSVNLCHLDRPSQYLVQ